MEKRNPRTYVHSSRKVLQMYSIRRTDNIYRNLLPFWVGDFNARVKPTRNDAPLCQLYSPGFAALLQKERLLPQNYIYWLLCVIVTRNSCHCRSEYPRFDPLHSEINVHYWPIISSRQWNFGLRHWNWRGQIRRVLEDITNILHFFVRDRNHRKLSQRLL